MPGRMSYRLLSGRVGSASGQADVEVKSVSAFAPNAPNSCGFPLSSRTQRCFTSSEETRLPRIRSNATVAVIVRRPQGNPVVRCVSGQKNLGEIRPVVGSGVVCVDYGERAFVAPAAQHVGPQPILPPRRVVGNLLIVDHLWRIEFESPSCFHSPSRLDVENSRARHQHIDASELLLRPSSQAFPTFRASLPDKLRHLGKQHFGHHPTSPASRRHRSVFQSFASTHRRSMRIFR